MTGETRAQRREHSGRDQHRRSDEHRAEAREQEMPLALRKAIAIVQRCRTDGSSPPESLAQALRPSDWLYAQRRLGNRTTTYLHDEIQRLEELRVQRSVQQSAMVTPRERPKIVSSLAATRMAAAIGAVEYTRSILAFGAGNIEADLVRSKFNSHSRLHVVRMEKYWEVAEAVKPLINASPRAAEAAKAEIARGGNCGEFSAVAFHYLRATHPGLQLNYCQLEHIGHDLVILGDLSVDSDADLVAVDAWPTRATACLWEDHFAHTPDREQVSIRSSITADGKDPKEAIKAGLKLTDQGWRVVEIERDQEGVDEGLRLKKQGGFLWTQARSTKPGHNFAYREEQ